MREVGRRNKERGGARGEVRGGTRREMGTRDSERGGEEGLGER